MADNKDQAAIERINSIYQQLRAGEKVNLTEVVKVAVALERIVKERDALLADLNALRAHLNCGLNCSCRDCTLNGSEHPCKCEQKYCEELDDAQANLEAAEGRLVGVEAGAEANRKTSAAMEKNLAAILLDNGRLRTALLVAVKLYGQPGGPWNVSSEPGEWLAMAKEALGMVEGEEP